MFSFAFFFFQAEDGIRDYKVTGVQTCALPVLAAEVAPAEVERRVVADRELRRQLLVQVDAEAGVVVCPVVAVLPLGAAGGRVLFGRRGKPRLLDCEGRAVGVEEELRRVTP